jgi:hypothetical protein
MISELWGEVKNSADKGSPFFYVRYHNHLDSTIKREKLTSEQEVDFFALHDEIGNRWSLIASNFKGITDNYLKNTFHSKLRGSIRKLNRYIKEILCKDGKTYPLNVIYEIIEACENNKRNPHEGQEKRQFCMILKNKLVEYNGVKTVHKLLGGLSEK